MENVRRLRPTPAMLVAMAALVLAMSGAAIALPGKNTVQSNDVKKNAIKAKHIKADAVGSSEIKADAVGAAEVADESLSDQDLNDYGITGNSLTRVTATGAATEAAARAAAPETPLFAKGQLSFYAKCFTDNANGDTLGEIYARTSADGSLLEGDDDLPGNPGAVLLNVATLEVDRQLDTEEVENNNEAFWNESEGAAASPDGTSLGILSQIGVKQGALAGGNGVYGDGNVCLFLAELLG